MKKNKAVNLNIGGFMSQVKTNQPDKKNAETEKRPSAYEPAEETVVMDQTEEMASDPDEAPSTAENTEELQEPAKETRRGKGRPPKKTLRSERLIFKLDQESVTSLALVKALNKVDIQDVVFAATVDFLKKHFSRSKGLDSEGTEIVAQIKKMYETK